MMMEPDFTTWFHFYIPPKCGHDKCQEQPILSNQSVSNNDNIERCRRNDVTVPKGTMREHTLIEYDVTRSAASAATWQ